MSIQKNTPMTAAMSMEEYYSDNEVDVENIDTRRCPVMILLDTSASVNAYKKDLEEAIVEMFDSLLHDDVSSAVEIGIVLFNRNVKPVLKIREIYKHKPEDYHLNLECRGRTHTGEGINAAVQLLQHRVELLHKKGGHTYQPILLIVTDGNPNYSDSAKETGEAAFAKACETIQTMVAKQSLHVICVGVGEHCDNEILDKMSGIDPKDKEKDKKGHITLKDSSHIKDFFKFVTTGIGIASKGEEMMNNSDIQEQINRGYAEYSDANFEDDGFGDDDADYDDEDYSDYDDADDIDDIDDDEI